jgi:DNA mismatch repair protein MutS
MSTDSTNPSIYREYFQRTLEYQSKYGDKTIVLMMVGAFYEVYGLTCEKTNSHIRSQIDEFATICNLAVSEKKFAFEGSPVVMAGFRDYTLDKYIEKLTEAGYTTAVFIQELVSGSPSAKPTYKRVLHAVYSPGTNISYDTEVSARITNHMMCIWLDTYMPVLQKTQKNNSGNRSMIPEKTRETIVFGVAVANIFTGKTAIFEHQSPFYLSPTTFDELERYVSVYSPSEIIILSPFDTPVVDKILQFSGVQTTTVHIVDTRNQQNERVQNCTKQKYIQHLLRTFFSEETYDVCAELHTNQIATQAFCYLMNFLQEHNPNLVKNMELPIWKNVSTRMLLANHTLKQLNIIENTESQSSSGPFSSVSKFLNKCSTAIGRRQFYTQIVNPVFDVEWLNGEYCMIDHMLQPTIYDMVAPIRKTMHDICDVEKLMRQLMVQKVYPASLHKLWKSIKTVQQLNVCIAEDVKICDYLSYRDRENPRDISSNLYIEQLTSQICSTIERVVDIDLCIGVQGFDTNIIRPGISPVLDATVRKYTENTEWFHEIRLLLNNIICSSEKNASLDYVKTHETEKSGLSLQITKKRANILKQYFNAPNRSPTLVLTKSQKTIFIKDIHFSTVNSTTDEIVFPLLNEITRDIQQAKQQLSNIVETVYLDFLKQFSASCYRALEHLCLFIAKMDILMTKTFVAKTYNYCRPNIGSANRECYVNAVGLRHCLIEHIQQNEIYVSNNIHLGKSLKDEYGSYGGLLLYGTNAVGKTSLIRALGIALILAQSGMYVPCTKFEYYPYTAIFSRILGNDNLFRGLSTFAVEMSELRMILKLADDCSLVLGDELCSGTETESALSIFMAGLEDLDRKQASFIFATHFHEILKMDEMSKLSRVAVKHMAVHFDRELDCLVYDRKLADGPGNRMYGLEVCKSLYLPPEFLEKAYEIRAKYFPETKGELSHTPTNTYNASKIRGKCEMCKTEIAEETHHLQEQRLATPDGFIGEFHKNHPANLMSLCSKCHNEFHSQTKEVEKPANTNPQKPTEKKVIRKKTTKGYTLVVQNEINGFP